MYGMDEKLNGFNKTCLLERTSYPCAVSMCLPCACAVSRIRKP
nr:hypothetical protein Q903MT_gene490 [Picea sitchensis]